MRLKPVPEPPAELSRVRELQRAVPLVPGSEDDCCVRLHDRCGLPNRQAANDWLAFLRMLGLVEETPRGFRRTEADPTPQRVRERLTDGVLLAPTALEVVRDAAPSDPVTATELFEATRDAVPRHDRARDPDWESAWRDRADRLLRWFALVDLARPVETGTTERDVADDVTIGYVAGDAVR
ncbi:hypothetical protein JCM18237_06980 [Halorubrum luteum]